MILTCPECATRYQTDAALFAPPGRKVKCAKCGHVWMQAPPPPEHEPESNVAAPEEVPEPSYASEPQVAAYAPAAVAVHERVYAPPPAVAKPRSPWPARIGLAIGWLGLAAIVLFVGWSADSYRTQIARLWPQTSSLYSRLGLNVNVRGLEIRDVFQRLGREDGQQVLAVSGTLLNVTGQELSVPKVSVTLTDDDNRALYQWSFSSGVDTLEPGKSVRFRTRLSSPPASARHVQVGLAGSGG